jgi:nicotinic acid mononucleotide adenylyltransferase
MKPNQLWLDVSTKELRIWVDSKLNLAQAKGTSTQRVGFFREIPLFVLPPASAHPMGWTSFAWSSMQGKFAVEDDFWMALDAARFTFLQDRPESLHAPLALEIPLTSDVYFYGGTFTPWHEGHRACLNLAPPNAPLIVCPDRNPHKPLRTHDDVVSFYLELKESIVKHSSHPVLVYPGFLLGQESNPTVSWVVRVKRQRPDLRIHLLMGYDSFKNLSTWTEAHDLIRLISGVAVVSRLEQDAQHAIDSVWALSHNPQLQIKFLGHHPYEKVSSTELLGKK